MPMLMPTKRYRKQKNYPKGIIRLFQIQMFRSALCYCLHSLTYMTICHKKCIYHQLQLLLPTLLNSTTPSPPPCRVCRRSSGWRETRPSSYQDKSLLREWGVYDVQRLAESSVRGRADGRTEEQVTDSICIHYHRRRRRRRRMREGGGVFRWLCCSLRSRVTFELWFIL